MIDVVNWCARRDAIEVGYRPRTPGRRIPSLPPVSLLMSYRPTHLDEGTGPTDLGLTDISQAATW
jgi:hypothetical protein